MENFATKYQAYHHLRRPNFSVSDLDTYKKSRPMKVGIRRPALGFRPALTFPVFATIKRGLEWPSAPLHPKNVHIPFVYDHFRN